MALPSFGGTLGKPGGGLIAALALSAAGVCGPCCALSLPLLYVLYSFSQSLMKLFPVSLLAFLSEPSLHTTPASQGKKLRSASSLPGSGQVLSDPHGVWQ